MQNTKYIGKTKHQAEQPQDHSTQAKAQSSRTDKSRQKDSTFELECQKRRANLEKGM